MSLPETPSRFRFAAVLSSSSHCPNERPVLERDPQVRVGDPVAQAARVEVELVDDQLVEQADDVGAGTDDEALVGERAARACAAPPSRSRRSSTSTRLAGLRKVRRGGEAVVAAADDHRVPVPLGELRHRLGKPDLPELGRDLVQRPAVPFADPAAPPPDPAAPASRRRGGGRNVCLRGGGRNVRYSRHVAVGDHEVEGVHVVPPRLSSDRRCSRGCQALSAGSSQTYQSCLLTMSQKPTASEGSKSSRAIVAGSKNHSQVTSVSPGERGQRVCSIT